MEVSQYNHLCQVFGTTQCSLTEVFNSERLPDVQFLHKFICFIKLTYIIFVDILVDKHCCLLHTITLGYCH